MILVAHNLDRDVHEDIALAESRVRGETMAAEDVLHDQGAISNITSDSQAMGRVGEVISRTWRTASKMKDLRGPLTSLGDDRTKDNGRVKRFVSKYTINPSVLRWLWSRGSFTHFRSKRNHAWNQPHRRKRGGGVTGGPRPMVSRKIWLQARDGPKVGRHRVRSGRRGERLHPDSAALLLQANVGCKTWICRAELAILCFRHLNFLRRDAVVWAVQRL